MARLHARGCSCCLGLVSALAGIVFTARLANARANNAVGFELDIITVALLGEVSVFGGRGQLTGVLWALVLIAVIRNVLGLSRIGGDAQGTIIGLLLIRRAARSATRRNALFEQFRPRSTRRAGPSIGAIRSAGTTDNDHRKEATPRHRVSPDWPSPRRCSAAQRPPQPWRRTAPPARSPSASCPSSDTDPYFQVAKTGADEAQKEIGGEVVQQAPSQATAEAQIEFINNLVSQQVKVIAISGNDANAVAPALKRAMAQGIRVVSYDSDVAPAARTLFLNQAKGDSLAEMMLESMAQLIGGEGEFAILSSTPTATNQNAWIDFMKARLAGDPKFAKMKLVQVAYGEESEQVNQQQALALAQAFPNLQGHHRPGRHRPAGGRPGAGAGWHDRQDQADRPGPPR